MAQFFAALFFGFATIASLAGLAHMLRSEWARVITILSGRELAGALAAAPTVRVRMRAWKGPERRQPLPLRAAA